MYVSVISSTWPAPSSPISQWQNNATNEEKNSKANPFQNSPFPKPLRAGYSSEETFAMFMENGTEKVLNEYCRMSKWVSKEESKKKWENVKFCSLRESEGEKGGERKENIDMQRTARARIIKKHTYRCAETHRN